ncbi:hypothetical protein OE88DRAFT_1803361 [Heliocybe sulcata]|uniref:Uncharacterized protein n=1 Tax=Heliocybe sulcata TaxID=5364 RepID=A0A5C3NSI7_9AGAM|nr:hypothetical protein OE88DRAFT_1803361 [Heliocybe sulcata]
MFSRVQKGGTVFKPVTRPKSRPPNEHEASSKPSQTGAADAVNSVRWSGEDSRAASAMPPRSSTQAPTEASGLNVQTSGHVFPAVAPASRQTLQTDPSLPSSSAFIDPPISSVSNSARSSAPILLTAGQTRAIPIVVSSARPVQPSVPPLTTSATTGTLHHSLLQDMDGPYFSISSATTNPVDIPATSLEGAHKSSAAASSSAAGAAATGPQPTPHSGRSNDTDMAKAPRQRRKARGKPASGDQHPSTEGPVPAKRSRRKRIAPETTTSDTANAQETTETPAKRQRRTKRASQDNSGADPELRTSQRRSRSPNERRKGRRRVPPLPPFDPEAPPGEEIDPTTVTMATLCDDTGQGRVSSKVSEIQRNFASWKASNREKRARMRAIEEAKKYGRRAEGEEPPTSNTTSDPDASCALDNSAATASNDASGSVAISESGNAAGPDESGANENNTNTDGFDYSQSLSTSRYSVQVRIGPNGETIVDEESLFVDRNEEDDTANYTHVEESDTTKFVNSATYSKKLNGSRWSAEETDLFFQALSQFGENYEMISMILPGRDRKACKNKFKSEDKRNPARINYCLTHRIPYDIQTLSRLTGKDFSGPTPEIRAPTPLTLAEPEQANAGRAEPQPAQKSRKKSRTPGLPSEGEEIMGTVEEFEDLGLLGSPDRDTLGGQ